MSPEATSILRTLITASNFAVIPPIIFLLLRWRHFTPAQRWFGGVLFLVFLNQMVAFFIKQYLGWPNVPLYHVYLLIEAPGLFLLFRYRFNAAPLPKALLWTSIGFVALTLFNAFFLQAWLEVPAMPRTVEAILVVALVLYYFRFVFKEQKVKHLSRSFWFWVSAGAMLYFSSNLLLFIFTNILRDLDQELFIGVWAIHAVLNFMLYAFYSIAFLCQDQESSFSS